MRMRATPWAQLALLLCTSCPAAPQATPPAPSTSSPSASAISPMPSASATSSAVAAPAKKVPRISASEAERVLFLQDTPDAAQACRDGGDDRERIHCLLDVLYSKDPQANEAARTLYDEVGIIAGVEPRQTMDGGWRGMLELVPEPALGRHRRHLLWLVAAYRDYTSFFRELQARGGAESRYRFAPIRLRFFRSVGRTTPSAYASGWTVAYNVSGSLHTTPDAVRETMFHETFHLNDRAHGGWSSRVLTPHYDAVVARCTQNQRLTTSCLTPFAPNETMVRGGTYYAFQPGNGVWEYAAELAIRYYREHRDVLANTKKGGKPFKCGPEPNPSTWKLLADEFFGGVDLVPPC